MQMWMGNVPKQLELLQPLREPLYGGPPEVLSVWATAANWANVESCSDLYMLVPGISAGANADFHDTLANNSAVIFGNLAKNVFEGAASMYGKYLEVVVKEEP